MHQLVRNISVMTMPVLCCCMQAGFDPGPSNAAYVPLEQSRLLQRMCARSHTMRRVRVLCVQGRRTL